MRRKSSRFIFAFLPKICTVCHNEIWFEKMFTWISFRDDLLKWHRRNHCISCERQRRNMSKEEKFK